MKLPDRILHRIGCDAASIFNVRSLALLCLLVCLVTLPGCINNFNNLSWIVGNNKISTERREIPSFRGIRSTVAANIFVTCKTAPGLSITTDENIVSSIRTEIVDGVLQISSNSALISPTQLTITIGTDSLQSVILEGSGNVNVTSIAVDRFSALLTGSGNVIVQGTTVSGDYTITGLGNINAQQLTAQQVTVSISGSASIRAWAAQSITGTISGSGNIVYYGNPPQVQINITGSGSARSGQ